MPKFIFDENIGSKVVKAIQAVLSFHKNKSEVKYIFDFYPSGVPDNEWIVGLDNDWIIITADRARKYGGGKLPLICKEKSISVILLSSSMHNQNQFYKVRAIIYLWDKFLEIDSKPRGTQFLLKYSNFRQPQLVEKK